MRTANRKDVLTTGEVAKICHVAPRTVSKWVDTGELSGYRIPGSRDRRIPLDQLVAFMRVNHIPLSALDGGMCRLLIVSTCFSPEVLAAARDSNRHEIRVAANGFEAGMIAQQFRPHAVVLEIGQETAEAVTICQNIKGSEAFGAAKVLAAVACLTDERRASLIAQGFEECLPLPYSLAQLAAAVDKAINWII